MQCGDSGGLPFGDDREAKAAEVTAEGAVMVTRGEDHIRSRSGGI